MRLRGKLFTLLTLSASCTQHGEPPIDRSTGPAGVAMAINANTKVTQVQNLFLASHEQPAHEFAAPWSLTASDGSGLMLTRVDAKAVVEGPLAFTELHLYFHNPEPRQREGTFSITLPTGAAVSRFAMENAGQFMEAEVVEKQLARRAYEDFLHRRQDPALLEKGEGNEFSARVFPIPASGDKHLVISFSQEVTPGHYTLPLRGLAKSERVDVQVQVRGRDGGVVEQTMSERNWTPNRDVVVDGSTVNAPVAISAGDLIAARVAIAMPQSAEAPKAVTLLVDTSASRALGFAAEARSIHALVDELAHAYGGALPVQVVAFDQVTTAIYDGRADAIGNIEKTLVDRDALGASDLGQALTWIGEHGAKSRVVIVTDGVVTAGAASDALPAMAKALAGHGVERIDVALAGGIRDAQAAAVVAHAGLPHTGAVLDLDNGVPEVAKRLGLAVRTEVAVAVDGAKWVFPRTIAAAQNGDLVTVFARRDSQAQDLKLTIAGAQTTLAAVAVNPALLGRAVAGAEITELDGTLATSTGDAATKLRAEIVKRSVAARVVSSQTSMLVLETDADYARYGIDRSALAEILAIGPTGVELVHRTLPPVQMASPTKRPTNKGDSKDKQKEEKKANEDHIGRISVADQQLELAKHADLDSDGKDDEKNLDFAATEQETSINGQNRPAPGSASTGRSRGDDRDRSERRMGGEVAVNRPAPVTAPVVPEPPPVGRIAPARETPPPPPMAPPHEMHEMLRGPMHTRQQVVVADPNDDGLSANLKKPSLTGPLAEIESLLSAHDPKAALAKAQAWHHQSPGDVLALIGLGDSLEAAQDLETAARVYGSIIDLYPSRADFRRFAGERLERIGKAQHALVIDTYKRAVAERPDHLTGHRLLAYALVEDGQYAEAFAAILAALDQKYPPQRYAGAERVLAEDGGMIGAAYLAHAKDKRDEIVAALAKRNTRLATEPSTRFIMYWETDANDVDFHIRDARGGHAWYSHKQLASGGELYADITTGYGPECFAIPGKPSAGPYELSINYYSQGPMGYGMGLLQVQKFDRQGNISLEHRPYVIMTNQAFVNLGTYR
jgi:tetratricopeptide (TPR) repeat protein